MGVKNSLTTSLSASLDRMETMEIGRMWEGSAGAVILGMGLITAVFHCAGTVEDSNDRLKRWAKGLEIKGAAILRNQDGKLSGPGDVGESLSKSIKTWYSVKGLVSVFTVVLAKGRW